MRSSARGASVSPSTAAEAWAVARSSLVSMSFARDVGSSGIALVMSFESGVDGAVRRG